MDLPYSTQLACAHLCGKPQQIPAHRSQKEEEPILAHRPAWIISMQHADDCSEG